MSSQSRTPIEANADLYATPVFQPSLRRRLAVALVIWRDRVRARRMLMQMDNRALRDAGISPAAAAYESGKPFWQPMGGLR